MTVSTSVVAAYSDLALGQVPLVLGLQVRRSSTRPSASSVAHRDISIAAIVDGRAAHPVNTSSILVAASRDIDDPASQ